jgi:hypothetical protein
MFMREHPGRVSTKSAANAWKDVTNPRAVGVQLFFAVRIVGWRIVVRMRG